MSEANLQRTPLYDSHVALGARMVAFAGYEMPVQYPTGVMAEHNWTREHAGLFDVSHMGQCFIESPDFETTARAMERIVPADVLVLAPHQQRYSQLLADDGGILDDVMITKPSLPGHEGQLFVVVNASRKDHDFAHISKSLPANVNLKRSDDLALIAVQGPSSEVVMEKFAPSLSELKFMHHRKTQIAGVEAYVSRSGYTGEDGFEISIFAKDAATVWSALLADPQVKPIGLGARDSLRLEAGLCLYGHDIDETTSPIEAGLLWSIGKRRRAEGGFIGAERVLQEISGGTSRKRVGIKPEGKAPAREGTVVLDMTGREIGKITSGGFGPTVNGPVAMGYVETASATDGTAIQLVVREKKLPARVVRLPFVPNRFKR